MRAWRTLPALLAAILIASASGLAANHDLPFEKNESQEVDGAQESIDAPSPSGSMWVVIGAVLAASVLGLIALRIGRHRRGGP